MDNLLNGSFENFKNFNNEDSVHKHKAQADSDISSFSMSSIGKIIKNRAFIKPKSNEGLAFRNNGFEQTFSYNQDFEIPSLRLNRKY